MKLVANAANDQYLGALVETLDTSRLSALRVAVAFTSWADPLVKLAKHARVPFMLYTVADGHFPNPSVIDHFVGAQAPLNWSMFLTRDYFHAKVVWFEGVGAYVGSANLSQKAWWNSIECGVWFDDVDLTEQEVDGQLGAFFHDLKTNKRFVQATAQHAAALRELTKAAKRVDDEQARFKVKVDQALAGIPGESPPLRPAKVATAAARCASFVAEFDTTLTILTKITREVADARGRWPSWVSRDVPPTFVQDQVTEYWWEQHCRRAADGAAEEMLRCHARNAGRSEAAVAEMITEWAAFDDPDAKWRRHINDSPGQSQRLLAADAIPRMGAEDLATVLFNTHAAREHASRIEKAELGDEGQTSTQEERCRLFALQLLLARTKSGQRTVQDVLSFVCWGDAAHRNVGERIWLASNDPAWKIPRLSTAILGEMVGYARAGELPPRNNRVSKTLHALGFPSVHYTP